MVRAEERAKRLHAAPLLTLTQAVADELFAPNDEPAPLVEQAGQNSVELNQAEPATLEVERAAFEAQKAELATELAALRRGQEQLRQGQIALAACMATAPRAKPVATGHTPSSARRVNAHVATHVACQSGGRGVSKDSPRVLSLANIPMHPGERPSDVFDVSREMNMLRRVARLY